MIAIDTNILTRLIAQDDPEQFARSRALVERETVFVALTVLLESEWALRRSYGLSRLEVAAALDQFLGLSNVVCEDPDRARFALDAVLNGMDFADALHLSGAQACDGFATFDRDFIKVAGRLFPGRVHEP